MSLFTQCCSEDSSVVMCGSSKKAWQTGWCSGHQAEKPLASLVSLVEKESIMWAWILEQWMLPLGHLGRFLKWGWSRKQNFSTACSHTFSLNSNKIWFSFSGSCPIRLFRYKVFLAAQYLKAELFQHHGLPDTKPNWPGLKNWYRGIAGNIHTLLCVPATCNWSKSSERFGLGTQKELSAFKNPVMPLEGLVCKSRLMQPCLMLILLEVLCSGHCLLPTLFLAAQAMV